MTFQDLILKLQHFWSSQGCLIQQPLDLEVGAGTSHPETLLRVLGPTPWNVAYIQPSRRPGRRAVRAESESAVQASPAAGDPQAVARRSAADLSRQPRGGRHQSAAARHPVRRRQLGIADARRLGHRLAGDARRHRDHAVHLLPAGRRHRPVADLRARSPTASNASRCSCRRSTTSSTSSGAAARNTATSGCAKRSSSRSTRSTRTPASIAERYSTFHRHMFDENYKFGEELLKGGLDPAGARALPEVLAPVQPARLERQRRRHRAHGLHPARAASSRSRFAQAYVGSQGSGSREPGAGSRS